MGAARLCQPTGKGLAARSSLALVAFKEEEFTQPSASKCSPPRRENTPPPAGSGLHPAWPHSTLPVAPCLFASQRQQKPLLGRAARSLEHGRDPLRHHDVFVPDDWYASETIKALLAGDGVGLISDAVRVDAGPGRAGGPYARACLGPAASRMRWACTRIS
jgi:hypothetical protein